MLPQQAQGQRTAMAQHPTPERQVLVLGPLRNGVSHYAQHRPLNSTQSLWRVRPRAESVMKLPPAPAVDFPAPSRHREKLRWANRWQQFSGTEKAWIQMGGQEVKRTHELTRGSYLEAICQVLERQARAKPSCAKDMEISP